ncbi:MAG: bifunctional diaminohydroxyphosphoribosylaminopyrimidine deaminase/5-amino-6-(5-phosphoribosylamino)uracil reductase RibD [Salinivirgaceae bacterium]|nr:bifunctional diaminohydroxyphosphoribosylaminopyrimidine deaminase/5-amino-6-(5-phosphoribosylamino)uracil reductase RibD [Salinivirgaceae bacterium]
MQDSILHEKYMKRCLQLAKNGKGKVSPNPLVGSVIVHNNQIIGEGYHRKYGHAHAEVHAIVSVKNKELLSESTIYVNLEPCSHFGKTPPCANLIIENKIPNVVIGMQDPFAKVNGQGITMLQAAGCNVTVGVLENECCELNKEFTVFHMKKRPYIVLKWAETLDGFIDKKRDLNDLQEPNWITNEVCRSLVHKWRSNLSGIMIGTNTAQIDNPKLNVRSWHGENPLRIIIDNDLSLSKNLSVFDQSQPSLILNSIKNDKEGNNEFVKIAFGDSFLSNLMHVLAERNISSLLVEGGQKLIDTFIKQNLWDEARVFVGNRYFINGVSAPKIRGKIIATEKLRDNYLSVYKNQ